MKALNKNNVFYLQVVEEISRQFLLLDSTYNNDGDLIQPKHPRQRLFVALVNIQIYHQFKSEQ